MAVTVIDGDLLDQRDVDAIVNAWNRNFVPRCLLLPSGVSGAIKRASGPEPFRELRRHGMLPLGAAVLTAPGRLPYRGIIHVAGLNVAWRATAHSIQASTRNAIDVARHHEFRSIAVPVIGAGSGGYNNDEALDLIVATAAAAPPLDVRVVRWTTTHRR